MKLSCTVVLSDLHTKRPRHAKVLNSFVNWLLVVMPNHSSDDVVKILCNIGHPKIFYLFFFELFFIYVQILYTVL